MTDNNYGYGTREYLKDYINVYSDRVSLVKLTTGEMLIGFVYDDTFENILSVDFPVEVVAVDSVFGMKEYTPHLAYKSLNFKNENVLFTVAPEESIVQSYLMYIDSYTFISDSDLTETLPSEEDTIH